jgi:hypothetical protein
MDAKHRGIQVFGWLSVIAGYGFALLLLRGILIGITQGFAGRPQVVWILLGYLLFLALAAYLFTFGRRAISIAKGIPRPSARFGWGRIMLGTMLIFGAASAEFHPFPTGAKSWEYENQTQAAAGHATTIAICIGCVFLIFSGIWKGFGRRAAKPDASPTQSGDFTP